MAVLEIYDNISRISPKIFEPSSATSSERFQCDEMAIYYKIHMKTNIFFDARQRDAIGFCVAFTYIQ